MTKRFRFACALVTAFLVVVSSPHAQAVDKADLIIVWKAKHALQLFSHGVMVRSYSIALGLQPTGPKRRRGDNKTPEGIYVIDGRTTRTPYHRALHISYPNNGDLALARVAHTDPGDDIWIHGMPDDFGRHDPVRFFHDWTNGCISVGNIAIEEIWNAVQDGTPIEILP